VNCSICTFASQLLPQDPAAKLTSIKAAQKFFSEDKERSFEAKVGLSHSTGAIHDDNNNAH
jgi:hypothetical protein